MESRSLAIKQRINELFPKFLFKNCDVDLSRPYLNQIIKTFRMKEYIMLPRKKQKNSNQFQYVAKIINSFKLFNELRGFAFQYGQVDAPY